jgi:NAD+ diphosphatase
MSFTKGAERAGVSPGALPPPPQVGEFCLQFLRAYPPAEPAPGTPRRYLPFPGPGKVALCRGGVGVPTLLDVDRGAGAALLGALRADGWGEELVYLGQLGPDACYAVSIPADTALPDAELEVLDLRSLYGRVPEAVYGLAGYATQVLGFRRQSRFCPVDGRSTEPEPNSWARRCPECGLTRYPPVSPAVLILVHDGADRILLAQKPGWGRRHSILAGFVEPGETLEECCYREALEEAGVTTTEFQYQGSQPWPFPHQLMVGFFCRHAAGEIRIDTAELERAEWFRFDALPQLPPPLSLSRQLIDRWTASRRT